MPLHKDDPNAPGNLTDIEYETATRELIAAAGYTGLHLVPEEILAAAVERAKGRDVT